MIAPADRGAITPTATDVIPSLTVGTSVRLAGRAAAIRARLKRRSTRRTDHLHPEGQTPRIARRSCHLRRRTGSTRAPSRFRWTPPPKQERSDMTSAGHPLRPLSHVTAQNVVVRASVGHRSSRRPTSQGDVGSPAGFAEVEVARAANRLDPPPDRRPVHPLRVDPARPRSVGSDHVRTRQRGSTSTVDGAPGGSCSARRWCSGR